MSLREKINEQFNAALKSKNKTLISTLRLILAAIKERDIANRTSEKKEAVKDPEIIKVLRKMKKQRQDSAVLYKKGERLELLEAEEAEIKIIDTFLPKQLNEEETKKICKETIESVGAIDEALFTKIAQKTVLPDKHFNASDCIVIVSWSPKNVRGAEAVEDANKQGTGTSSSTTGGEVDENYESEGAEGSSDF